MHIISLSSGWNLTKLIQMHQYDGERSGQILVTLTLFARPLHYKDSKKKGKRKVQGVPQSQTAAHPRPQEEEETDKSKHCLMCNLFSLIS